MSCENYNQKFAIDLSKCPNCGELVTEDVKESLIYWASFGILVGVASIVLAVSTSFPNSPVHRVYQLILIVMGPLLIFSGLRHSYPLEEKFFGGALVPFYALPELDYLYSQVGWQMFIFEVLHGLKKVS